MKVPSAAFIQLITTSSAELAGLGGTVAKGTFGIPNKEMLHEYHPIAHFSARLRYFRDCKTRIVTTAPPKADFDGDGTIDAVDKAPYDPTKK